MLPVFASCFAPLHASQLDDLLQCPWSQLLGPVILETETVAREATIDAVSLAWRRELGGAVAARAQLDTKAFDPLETRKPSRRQKPKSRIKRKRD